MEEDENKTSISNGTIDVINSFIEKTTAAFSEIDRKFGVFVTKFQEMQEEISKLKESSNGKQVIEGTELLKTSMDILKKTFIRLEDALERIDNLEKKIDELGYNEPKKDERQKELKQFKENFLK